MSLPKLKPWQQLALLVVALFALGFTVSACVPRLRRGIIPQSGPGGLIDSVPGLPTITPTAIPLPVATKANFLILGVDRGIDENDDYAGLPRSVADDPGRSDAMAILTIDPQAMSITILGIPRDLWLEIPDGRGGWSMGRIDEAYRVGAGYALPGGGAGATAAAVTHDLGVPIDHWVVLDFTGFMNLIDALGGVTVEAPETLARATVRPKANNGGYEHTFEAGIQHLSGELALAYARFRGNSDGDFGRIRQQQQIALAAREQAVSLGWAGRALEVWEQWHASVGTDLQAPQAASYALVAARLTNDGIRTRSLGQPDAASDVILAESGANVLIPEPHRIAAIITETFGDPSFGETALASLQRQYPSPAVSLGVRGGSPPIIHTPSSYSAAR